MKLPKELIFLSLITWNLPILAFFSKTIQIGCNTRAFLFIWPMRKITQTHPVLPFVNLAFCPKCAITFKSTGCVWVIFRIGHTSFLFMVLHLILKIFENVAKIGKLHAIRNRNINALGNFMKTCSQNKSLYV